MKDQTCDLCDPDAPTTAMFMVSVLGTGDVKLVCPADLIAMGDALRDQLTAVEAHAVAQPLDTEPATAPDPVTGDDTDEDQAADGEHADTDDGTDECPFCGVVLPGAEQEAHVLTEHPDELRGLVIGTRPDATPDPPDQVPADTSVVGSG